MIITIESQDIINSIKQSWFQLFDEQISNNKLAIIYTTLHLRTVNFTFIKNYCFENNNNKYLTLTEGIKNFLLSMEENYKNTLETEDIYFFIDYLNLNNLRSKEYVLAIYKEGLMLAKNPSNTNRLADTNR